MNKFLVITPKETSEWINSFSDVQYKMNKLENCGMISNVKVQKFQNNILVKEIVYNYNGEQWESK